MGVMCSTNGKVINAYKIVVVKAEETFRRPRRRWKYNIRKDVRKE